MLLLLTGLGFFFVRRAKARKAKTAIADTNREVSRETLAHSLTIPHLEFELVRINHLQKLGFSQGHLNTMFVTVDDERFGGRKFESLKQTGRPEPRTRSEEFSPPMIVSLHLSL